MNDRRRHILHSLNAWLIPLIAAALIAVGGFIGVMTITTGHEVTRIATIQKQVRADQLDMKETLGKVSDSVTSNGIKLDEHLIASGYISKTNAFIHHRPGMSPCQNCHSVDQPKGK